MSTVERRPYLTSVVLDQQFLNDSADNLTNKLEMIAVITTPNRTIRVSDRDKYVDDTFYESRVVFPDVQKTLGDYLAGVLEFSSIELQINNADEEFNDILPGGDDYDGFIDSDIIVSVGLGEISSTYTNIFEGKVTEVAGFQRDRTSFTLIARSNLEQINEVIPQQHLIADDFPDIEDDFVGLGAPVIYGDWTTNLRLIKLDPDDQDSESAEVGHVPAFPVNGNDVEVNASLDDPSAGDTELRLVIAGTPISSFLTDEVYLLRGNKYYLFDSGDIAIVPSTDNTVFDITQKNLLINSDPWIYNSGDQFWVKVKGVELGSGTYDENIVAQGRDILERLVGASPSDFDSSWNDFRDKSSPSESDITSIVSRVWLQEGQPAFEYVLSMLEQVRIEAYVNRDNKFALTSTHFDDFGTKHDPDTNFTVRNWDMVEGSLRPQIDELNNFNRAKADFDFDPSKGENRLSTPLFRNQAAVDQAQGRLISKLITFPNMPVQSQVETQLKEILKLASAGSEMVVLALNSRAFLLDLADFVVLNIDIGSVDYIEIPAMIRRVGYDPEGPNIPLQVWSMQLVNFPAAGGNPGHTGPAGTVGGYDATITQET